MTKKKSVTQPGPPINTSAAALEKFNEQLIAQRYKKEEVHTAWQWFKIGWIAGIETERFVHKFEQVVVKVAAKKRRKKHAN